MKADAILETALYCDDLDAAERFYEDVLGLDRIARREGRHAFFRCGPGVLLLFDADRTSHEETRVNDVGVPLHGARGAGHIAFRASADELESWRAHLRSRGVAIEAEIEWPQGGRSLYFRDPSGNSLELATPALWGLDADSGNAGG